MDEAFEANKKSYKIQIAIEKEESKVVLGIIEQEALNHRAKGDYDTALKILNENSLKGLVKILNEKHSLVA